MNEHEYVLKETCEERHQALRTALGLKAQHTTTMLAVVALLIAAGALIFTILK